MDNYEDMIKKGDYYGAEAALINLLSKDRLNIVLNFALGVVYAILNNFSQSKFYLKTASNLDPLNFQILNNLGNVLCELNEISDALICFSRAIELSSSSDASLFFNRGRLHHLNKNFIDAITDYKSALQICPIHLDAKNNLSLCLIHTGDLKNAEIILLDLSKEFPNQTTYLLNLANLYLNLSDRNNCILYFKKILQLDPKNYINYYNIANAFYLFGEFSQALVNYSLALKLNHNHYDSYVGRGNVHNSLNLFFKSISDFNCAIKINSNNTIAYYNLGCTYLEIKDLKNALVNFDIVISKDENHFNAHFNKSLVLLLSGNYLDGWKLYEYRYKCNTFPNYNFLTKSTLLTSSNNLIGKKLLVYCEQGFGDIIQFIRFIKILKKLGAFIILLAPIELKCLFDSVEFIDLVITEFTNDISFDYHYPLISLPFLYGIELNDIENDKYLYSNSNKIECWRNRIINSNNKLNVGIVWRGTTSIKKVDNQRQIPLNLLLSYLPKELNYHCIQKDLSYDEIFLLAENSISFYSDYLIDFSETAALCSNLDLIVTIDTSIAHLAGALGINTFLLLSTSSDWRWHLHGSESLWYKSIKIFRQKKVELWDNLLNEIRNELIKLADSSSKRNALE